MKQLFFTKKLPLLVLGSALIITVAVAQTGAGSNKTDRSDTVPRKQKQVRDLDEALIELDKGEVELQKAMREIDGEKLERELRSAMKNLDVDMAKMKEEMAKALSQIDAQKINLEVQKGMAEMQKALKEVDAEKIKADVQASLAKIDTEKMRAEMQKLKEMDFSKMRKDIEAIRPEIEKSMREARKDIEKARLEITFYKNLVDALDRDGHLKKSDNYNIDYKDGDLTVNGKKLPAADAKKYAELLSGRKDFTLRKNDDGMNVNDR